MNLSKYGITEIKQKTVIESEKEEKIQKSESKKWGQISVNRLPFLKRNLPDTHYPHPKRRKLFKRPQKIEEVFENVKKRKKQGSFLDEKEIRVQPRFVIESLVFNKKYSLLVKLCKSKKVDLHIELGLKHASWLEFNKQTKSLPECDVKFVNGCAHFPLLGTLCFDEALNANSLRNYELKINVNFSFGVCVPVMGESSFSFLIAKDKNKPNHFEPAMDRTYFPLPLLNKRNEKIGVARLQLRWNQITQQIRAIKEQKKLRSPTRIENLLKEYPSTQVCWIDCETSQTTKLNDLVCRFCRQSFIKIENLAWHLHHDHAKYKVMLKTWKVPEPGMAVCYARTNYTKEYFERLESWDHFQAKSTKKKLFEEYNHVRDVFQVEKEESEPEEPIEEISDKEEDVVSMGEETETDESEVESSEQIEEPNYERIDTRKIFMDKSIYIHGQSMMRRTEKNLKEIEGDSDYDGDDEWFRAESRKLLLDFSDVSYSEKTFMNAWNTFLCDPKYHDKKIGLGCYALYLLPTKLFQFAHNFGGYILSRNLRTMFLNHCLTMWEFGYIESMTITIAMRILDKNVANPDLEEWKKIDLFGKEELGEFPEKE